MNAELQKQLYDKYPKIFADVGKDMTQSCMAWGIECGNGWFNLLDTLCGYLQSYTDNNSVTPIVAEQVKEKFGGLRFYARGGNNFTSGVISFAEEMSKRICEVCGNPGLCNGSGWLVTLCEEHRAKRNNNED